MEYKQISSKNNPIVVECAKLLQKKHREKQGLFIIEGIKLAVEAMRAKASAKYIFLDEQKVRKDPDFCSEIVNFFANEAEIFLTNTEVLQKICGEISPEGIICVLKRIDKIKKIDKINTSMSYLSSPVMVFDKMRDPGNLGTVIRTALAFGVEEIFISPDCADIYSLKTLRGSMGAVFWQKMTVCDSGEVIEKLKRCGYTVYGAALHTDSVDIGDISITDKTAFVIGNEANGLSEDILSLCSRSVIIPMGEFSESLNASVCSAIFMWEISKHKRSRKV